MMFTHLRALHYTLLFLFCILLVAIFYWIGIVGGYRTGFGVVAIVIFFMVIYENITEGRLRKYILWFLTICISYAFVLPFTFNVLLPPSIQYAFESTESYVVLQIARLLHRPGVTGALSRQEHCFAEENRLIAMEIQARIDELNLLVSSGNTEAESIRAILKEAKVKPKTIGKGKFARKEPGLTIADLTEIQQSILKMPRALGVGVGNTARMTIYKKLVEVQEEIEAEILTCLEDPSRFRKPPKLPAEKDLPSTGVGWWYLIAGLGFGGIGLVCVGLMVPHARTLGVIAGIGMVVISVLFLGHWWLTRDSSATQPPPQPAAPIRVATEWIPFTAPPKGQPPVTFPNYRYWRFETRFYSPEDAKRAYLVGTIVENGVKKFPDGIVKINSVDERELIGAIQLTPP